MEAPDPTRTHSCKLGSLTYWAHIKQEAFLHPTSPTVSDSTSQESVQVPGPESHFYTCYSSGSLRCWGPWKGLITKECIWQREDRMTGVSPWLMSARGWCPVIFVWKTLGWKNNLPRPSVKCSLPNKLTKMHCCKVLPAIYIFNSDIYT